MNKLKNTFIIVGLSLITAFAQDKISFSGHVTENIGCLEMVPAPIENAKVKVYDDMSCMINGMLKSRAYLSSCIDSTFTDDAGYYHFNNLVPDSFSCQSVAVEVDADGYYIQQRYIYPKQDSILDFALIKESSDSTYPVTVTVYAVDTNSYCGDTGYCSPEPLEGFRIEISDPLLFWWPIAEDTTDKNGKAEFPSISAVPLVDYEVSAATQSEPYYHEYTITNIASCMGNDVTIYIHIPRPISIHHCKQYNKLNSIEFFTNRFNSNTIIKFHSSGLKVQSHNVFLKIYDIKGKLVKHFGENFTQNSLNSELSFTWNVNDLPGGLYLLKIDIGNKIFSKQIFISR